MLIQIPIPELLFSQRGGAENRSIFPRAQTQFLIRRPLVEETARNYQEGNDGIATSALAKALDTPDVLVRLPSIRDSPWRVIVLQKWIGRVDELNANGFMATLTDATNPHNPPEYIKFDEDEVSAGDIGLLARGATFYWSIGYRDAEGGQRERVSTLRFARLGRFSKAETDRIFEKADRLTAFLESD
jgi:hypothetical protein